MSWWRKRRSKETVPRKTGLDRFWSTLANYRRLLLWAFGSSAVPLAFFFLSLSPPWPKGIVAVTSIIEVVAIILGFQWLGRASRKVINRTLSVMAPLLLLFLITYLGALSFLTYTVPDRDAIAKESRFAVGMQCKPNVQKVFGEACPFVDKEVLRQFEYDAAKVWTTYSITQSRLLLIVLWFGVFFTFPFLVSGFLANQERS